MFKITSRADTVKIIWDFVQTPRNHFQTADTPVNSITTPQSYKKLLIIRTSSIIRTVRNLDVVFPATNI